MADAKTKEDQKKLPFMDRINEKIGTGDTQGALNLVMTEAEGQVGSAEFVKQAMAEAIDRQKKAGRIKEGDTAAEQAFKDKNAPKAAMIGAARWLEALAPGTSERLKTLQGGERWEVDLDKAGPSQLPEDAPYQQKAQFVEEVVDKAINVIGDLATSGKLKGEKL